jgi:hypothetical protein
MKLADLKLQLIILQEMNTETTAQIEKDRARYEKIIDQL